MELSHIDKNGNAKMVDVSAKDSTKRIAKAHGKIFMKKATLELVQNGNLKKGDVLTTAKIAGVMAAKSTANAIPMCHNIMLSGVDVEFDFFDEGIEVFATTKTVSQTGVEMEALHAVSVALLTIYDMAKAVDREMTISDVELLEKQGGKSGHFVRK